MAKILHPCFDETESGYRIHLPIAKQCNTKCNYCKIALSKGDQRPGVAERILAIDEIVPYINKSLARYKDCKIIGIAGPGDPLANPDELFAALELVSRYFPGFKKCICTNGFWLEDYVDQIRAARIDYMTLTMNAINADTLSKIYQFISYHGEQYEGAEAGRLILTLQKTALELLSLMQGLKIKVNIVFIPGVNDQEMDELIQFLCGYPVNIINIIPLLPVADTTFETMAPFNQNEYNKMKKVLADKYPAVRLKQGCQRCRSDARGKIVLKENFSVCSKERLL
ncbi:MAG TPA: nitrogenase molybdenum-iron cofactor biosynthesis protein [Ruminococcaceae bacterium]|nr:nitrogenase molybdenum-iron cofactor biosynthesis protein [Oscillospiraceae bacterium]